MKHAFPLLLLTFFLQQINFAQIADRYQVRHYDTENGLPSNGIKGIQWDEQTGFLWIGTEAGIVRFNGIDFKTFSNHNTPFIESERIRGLFRSNSSGSIFAIDISNNILGIQKNKLFLSRQPGKNSSAPNYALLVSDKFFEQRLLYPISGPYPEQYLKDIFPSSDTSMLFILDEKVYSLTSSNNQVLPLETGNELMKAGFKIKEKIFLVSKENKIFLVDIASKQFSPVPTNQPEILRKKQLQFFWEPGMEIPIVISDNKAWMLGYDGTILDLKQICDEIPGNFKFTNVQYSAKKKLLFLGSDSRGLIVISENRINVVNKVQESPLETKAVYSQIELPGNAILTNEGYVIGERQDINQPLPIKGRFEFNTYITDDSLLWYQQPKGTPYRFYLHCYDYKTKKTTVFTKTPIDDHFAIACSGGKTYIATDRNFGVIEKDSIRYLFGSNTSKKEGFDVFTMTELSPGIFSVATCDGLINYNVTNHTTDTLLKLSGFCVRTLWKYKDYLFIGTYGKGYYVYKDGKLKAMPLDRNNFLNHVHCFFPDKDGYCWMSTNRGLFKSSLADLLNAFENNETHIYYHYYGRNDGMENTEMNGGCTPCALQMKNGTLSFPTMNGLVWVNPDQGKPILPEGEVFIDEVFVDNQRKLFDSMQENGLPADTREILVHLAFPAWSKKENLYIEYDLNNSGNWRPVNTTNDAVIRLYGLGFGNYHLRIRKMKGFGSGNYSYDGMAFAIATPWYLRWWVFVLLALVAYGIGRFFVQLRIRQYKIRQRKLEKQVAEKTKELKQKNEILEKNDVIKTRLISIISHDIVTPLKFLSVAGKNLIEKRQLMSEELQKETIGEMTNTSQELQLLSTNILNWIKYQNENRRLAKEIFNVKELVNHVIGVLNSMAHQKQLQLSNQVEDQLELYQFAEPLRILIHNLVSNAINFSENGTIIIRSQQESGNVMISVTDQGIGMSPEQVRNIMAEQIIISARKTDSRQGNGLGYLIIKDLVKMIGGELSINSEIGIGTTVSISIPSIQS